MKRIINFLLSLTLVMGLFTIPTVEVHISEVSEREAFRQISFVREYAFKTITGHGTDGYLEAIDALLGELR